MADRIDSTDSNQVDNAISESLRRASDPQYSRDALYEQRVNSPCGEREDII